MTFQKERHLQVYEPHRRGLPPLRDYLRSIWSYRLFAYYLARSGQKAQHTDTWLGQLWTVLNPLLLAGVYWLLIRVLGSSRDIVFLFAGLITFYFTRNSMMLGAKSIVGGASVVMRTRLPRALLPISAVISGLLMYVPSLLVYIGFHLAASRPLGPQLLALPLVVLIQSVFNLGLALSFSTLTVYFRDTSGFLPYLTRIWLYVSPVLYLASDVPDNFKFLQHFNPMTPILTAIHQILLSGRFPDASQLGLSTLWAVIALLVGGWMFLSKEREFAVRV
jgi:ABC-type polysaccharide/polyol phosphate export permease